MPNENERSSAAISFFLLLMQHMFCARIDPAIDDANGGKDVVVTEVR